MGKGFFKEEPRTYSHKVGEFPLNLIPPGEKWESVTEFLKIINKPLRRLSWATSGIAMHCRS